MINRKVLVCQNVTCHKQRAEDVLSAFQSQTPAHVTVEASGCLGHCGSGPMVLILPEEIWYSHLYPSDVPVIVEKHLQKNKVILKQQDPKTQAKNQSSRVWLVAAVLGLGLLILIAWVCSSVMGTASIR